LAETIIDQEKNVIGSKIQSASQECLAKGEWICISDACDSVKKLLVTEKSRLYKRTA
jgi:hypothetical protein